MWIIYWLFFLKYYTRLFIFSAGALAGSDSVGPLMPYMLRPGVAQKKYLKGSFSNFCHHLWCVNTENVFFVCVCVILIEKKMEEPDQNTTYELPKRT